MPHLPHAVRTASFLAQGPPLGPILSKSMKAGALACLRVEGGDSLLTLCLLPCAGAPLGAILNFLLQLGFREVGNAFRVDALSKVEATIAADVAQLGLLMPFL